MTEQASAQETGQPDNTDCRNNRVFLSYARDDDPPDQPFVRRLYSDLTAAGFKVWFDRESLMSRGFTFHQEIKDAIRTEVDRIVYVGGPKAAVSAYVREEWQFGLECDAVVVTPILRKGDYDLIPGELSLLHCEDFRDDGAYPAALAMSRQVRTAYPDGIVWISGGQHLTTEGLVARQRSALDHARGPC